MTTIWRNDGKPARKPRLGLTPNKDKRTRYIPDDVEPVCAQALLNLFLKTPDDEILAVRQLILDNAETANADYDRWLAKHRDATALPESTLASRDRKERDRAPQRIVKRNVGVG